MELAIEPGAGPRAVLDLLAAARRSVWMEMYLLTDERAIDALAGRAQAGCDVRVLLEPTPYRDETANVDAYRALAAAGVSVRWSSQEFTYTHAKAFTIDHERLVVMTLNLSGSGLSGNREYLAVDDDPTDVAAADTLFQADASAAGATPTTPAPAQGASLGPTERAQDRSLPTRLVTSPGGSRAALGTLVAEAARTLHVETEEVTDGSIVGALVAARARGVTVTFVWPGPADAGGRLAKLSAAGAIIRATSTPSIHGKAMVADGVRAYVGSANLSPTSLDSNREIGLLLDGGGDLSAAARLASTIADDAARGVPPAAL